MRQFLTAALYKFVELPDFAALQLPLLAVCETHGVKGTLLLAPEGINGTIAGPEADVHAVLAWLRSDVRLAALEHKASWTDVQPFYRMKVRLKKEIVTMGVPELHPALMAGQYVKPADWNALVSSPDVVLVDTRNDYEVKIGTFEGAVNPDTHTFTELPGWVEREMLDGGKLASVDGKKPRVAMFCTGGIRCEKSTALLRSKGFEEVYHLEGGILKYLETIPQNQSIWQGECFLFDERVSVGHALKPGTLSLCRSCRNPVNEEEKKSPFFELGVSCPHCHTQTSATQKAGYRERQKQVQLAGAHRQGHIGVKQTSEHGARPVTNKVDG